jgi:hypothetical protein
MKEIYSHNMDLFFAKSGIKGTCTYSNQYTGIQIWEISDEDYKRMCDISEEEFIKIAGDNAWWRGATGSVLGIPKAKAFVNGEILNCWDETPLCPDGFTGKHLKKFEDLLDYLCNWVGVSSPKNVCACAVDLAKYNN